MLEKFLESSSKAEFLTGDFQLISKFKTAKPIGYYTFICTQNEALELVIDGIHKELKPYSILALTPIQYLKTKNKPRTLIVYQFNREFYCIKDHDQEVSCVGLLFFGNSMTPIIQLTQPELKKFELLHEVILDEIYTKDRIQAEMLRLLLARFIIKCTRLFKQKKIINDSPRQSKNELLRQYNFLVEQHFRTQHNVGFYADKLHKSPKTLSNTFSKLDHSPLQIIHERIVLEAKRLLMYTDKTAREIAYEVGFQDASHLSRLFKKYTSYTPTSFKNIHHA